MSSLKSRTNRFHHVLQRDLQSRSRVMTNIVQLNKISADRCQKFDASHRTRHKLLLQDLKNIYAVSYLHSTVTGYRIRQQSRYFIYILYNKSAPDFFSHLYLHCLLSLVTQDTTIKSLLNDLSDYRFGLGLWCLMSITTNFSYIVAVSFICGENRSTRRKLSHVTDILYHIMLY
jgi:hypothetical protein